MKPEGRKPFEGIVFAPPTSQLEVSSRVAGIKSSNPNATGWSPSDVSNEFADTFRYMRVDLGIPLPLRGRDVLYVPRTDLVPQDERQRKLLIDTYGEEILDNIRADCSWLANGRFRIRLGYAGEEASTPMSKIAFSKGHEWGHTLGKRLTDPIAEEMKAFSFGSLVLFHMFGFHGPLRVSDNPKETHDLARDRINQLYRMGIDDEIILAHLTGRRFGVAGPNDYREYIR